MAEILPRALTIDLDPELFLKELQALSRKNLHSQKMARRAATCLMRGMVPPELVLFFCRLLQEYKIPIQIG